MVNKNVNLPPQDIEAENSILGALMIDKNAIFRVMDVLASSDFYHPANQKIYDAMLSLVSKSQPLDLLTVSAHLKDDPNLAGSGNVSYLTELVSRVPTAAHVVHYANIVREKKVRRDLIRASSEIHEKAFEEGDFETLLDDVEQRIFKISEKSRPQKFIHIKEELPGAYERLEHLQQHEGTLRGVPTYFAQLDNILSGLQKSDLVVIGARPSIGKTAFALDIARNAALGGKVVGVFSLEMSREQVIDRLIASQSQVPLWRLRTGRFQSDIDFTLIRQALDDLSQASLFVDDTSSPTILQIRAMGRRLQLDYGNLDLLIVDYLQLIQPRGNTDNIVQQITEISRGLKSLARELNVPVIALSQLSRNVEQRETKIPKLSDLRDSGSIEQDSDVVMFLYRKDREKIDISEEEHNIVEIIVAKHRNGPLGSVKLKFDPERVTFRSIDKHHMA